MNIGKYRRQQFFRRFVFTFFGSKWFSFPFIYRLRNLVYQFAFNIGSKPYIEYNVSISRSHGLGGYISIGNNVHLAKDVYIDYSGGLIIGNNVKIGMRSCIMTHYRDMKAFREGKDINIPTPLYIGQGAYIGMGSVILSTCNKIGENAHIGAGAVVLKDVPDNATVVGIPAKEVKNAKA